MAFFMNIMLLYKNLCNGPLFSLPCICHGGCIKWETKQSLATYFSGSFTKYQLLQDWKILKSISSDWPTLLFEEKAMNFMCKILPGLKAPPWYFLISILDHCCVGSFRVNGKLHGGEQWLYILLLPPPLLFALLWVEVYITMQGSPYW